MYKVPRERTKERKRPFVNSLRFKPPLKTLFELRECVFRERRRIERVGKSYLCGWVKTNRKKSVFPQKQSKREEGVGGVDSTFSSSRFEKSFLFKAGGEKELPKRELSTKKKEWKKRTKKHGQKASFFQANRKREKQRILTKESVIKRVLSQTRSFEEEEEERGQREASSFS